jgi:hypothetical protein
MRWHLSATQLPLLLLGCLCCCVGAYPEISRCLSLLLLLLLLLLVLLLGPADSALLGKAAGAPLATPSAQRCWAGRQVGLSACTQDSSGTCERGFCSRCGGSKPAAFTMHVQQCASRNADEIQRLTDYGCV